MCRLFFLFIVGAGLWFNSFGQGAKWQHRILVESYGFEMMDAESKAGEFYQYCGQSARYSVSRSLSNWFSAGIETGIFIHPRPGERWTTVHSYIPLQLTFKFSVPSNRFGFSISTGRPFFLSKEHYHGTAGFWYRDVWKELHINDESYADAQQRKIDDYYLVSNFRFHLLLSQNKAFGIHIGVQHYWFSDHSYKGGGYVNPYFAGKVTSNHCYNLSLGLSLELRSGKE